MTSSTPGAAVSASTRAASSSREVVMEGMTTTTTGTNSPNGIIDKGGIETRSKRCGQCGRRAPCNHHAQVLPPPGPSYSPIAAHAACSPASTAASANANGNLSAAAAAAAATAAPLHNRPRRISKLKHRALATTLASLKNAATSHSIGSSNYTIAGSSSNPSRSSVAAAACAADETMEPPVLSFYGTEPVPLPSRFAHIKRSLVAGHEAQLEASWVRLIEALRDEVEHIESRGPHVTPSIDFGDIDDPQRTAPFARDLKRYGLGVVRGVVPRADAQAAIAETVKYLETKHDFKAPSPQDPTCFDFFWTPAQVRTRAHPHVLQAQKFAMSLWDSDADDRMATRFPIAYADRLRIHGANVGGVGPDGGNKSELTNGDNNNAALEAQKAELELLGDFASSTIIAQVDNGSLERWEPDGYGRGGTYDAVFKGEWEKYDPWDPTFRVSATPDLYNGHGACSIFRMYQGILALSTIEPGLIRLLPSPKLATAYFLLRPFFSPKNKAPERRDGPEWEAFLDPSNWALDKEQSTIIHGAVPGHAQRLTELWHPHVHLRRTLVTIPTLQTGDYIVWHPDLAYHITSNPSVMASRAPTPPPMSDDNTDPAVPAKPVSILVYIPAAPLTQTSALYLARQRKTFQRGHPGPDFDSTGSGLGTEASHAGRPGETEIAEAGGPAGLQAMGLAPFDVAPTPPALNGEESDGKEKRDEDVEMEGASEKGAKSRSNVSRVEAEVARLANIILFPDRYDFYMAKRSGTSGTKRRADGKEKEKESEKRKEEERRLAEAKEKGKAKEKEIKEEMKDGSRS